MNTELTYEQEVVLSHVPVTRRDRISKMELNMVCGYSDRKTRRILAELRTEGYFIITLGDGIWLADPKNEEDLDAIETYHKIERAKAIAYFKRLKDVRRVLKENGRRYK